MAQKKFILIFLLLLLLLSSAVFAIDYIKSIREIPIKKGYEVILNYDVEREDINAVFIDDDTNERFDVDISDYFKLPDGTTKIKTNYVDADRIIFYYADTFDDWDFTRNDGICDWSDLQSKDSPDCIWERGNPIAIENVRLYKDSQKIYFNLKNVGKNKIDIADYSLFLDWGSSVTSNIASSNLLKDQKSILNPKEHYIYKLHDSRYVDKCNSPFFIGLISLLKEGEGKSATAIHNRDLECLEYQPTCGDTICSKYEESLNCEQDCEKPINLVINDGKANGIYFDYSYFGDNCIYQIFSPTSELYSSKESLNNYKGRNLKDPNVRYNNQITNPISNIFSSFISGDYKLELICYKDGLEVSRQSQTKFICSDCLITLSN